MKNLIFQKIIKDAEQEVKRAAKKSCSRFIPKPIRK